MLSITGAVRQALLARAETFEGPRGRSSVANTVTRAGIHSAHLLEQPVIPALVHHLVSHTSIGGYATACRALAAAENWNPSAREDIPILVLTGDADYLVPEQTVAQWAEQRSSLRFKVLPRTGHWGGVENPKAIASALFDFVLTDEAST